MKLSQKVNKALRHGAHVVVKKKGGMYEVFSPFKSDNGNWRRSGCYPTPKSAKEHIGFSDGWPPEDIDDNYTEITEIFYTPFERFEVGDKVQVKELERVGVVEMVRNSNTYYIVDDEGDVVLSSAPHHQLIPYFEDEDKVTITVENKTKRISRTSAKELGLID